ncbi:MAG: dTDP-glucose 4,6-dehydratase [Armatimonadota bacterium]
MKILACGGAGFIGSNFCRYVLREHSDDEIVILDALTYAGRLSTIEDVLASGRATFTHGRIEDRSLLPDLLKQHRIDAVVNFAAETHNDRSLLGAEEFLVTNVLGVQALLDACLDCGIERIVQVSTDEVYGSIGSGKWTEDSPLMPNTPYSASKAAGDLLCRAAFVTYGTPVLITRGGNTYGPYQYPEKLIPFFCTRLLMGKKAPLYGEGRQVREWIHVDDHCAAIDVVLRKGEPGEVYNISDSNERENREVAAALLAALSADESLIKRIPDPRKGAHDQRYSMDSFKIRALGWSPRVPFAQGLIETARWYREHKPWWREIVESSPYQTFLERFYGSALGPDL